MSGMTAHDQAPEDASAIAPPGWPRPLSERWCPWCRAMHGFGYCAHASWLTHAALSRRGAHFNWR
jgi:hypothetical protein